MKTTITTIVVILTIAMNAQRNEQIQTLIDKQEIIELQSLYAQALDKQEWSLLEDVFEEKFTVDFSKWGVPVTKMSITDFIQFMQKTFSTEGLQTQHTMSNFKITISGNTAQSEIYVLAKHKVSNAAGEFYYDMNGYYSETYIKKNGTWKITSIQLNPRWATGDEPSKIFTF